MDVKQIERLMRTMQQHGVTSLELTEGETRLFMARQEQAMAQVPVALEAAVVPQAVEAPAAQDEETQPQTGSEILSPMVGTYHERGKSPVKVGDKLKKGEVLCVIEAMKLMNDIAMEEDGEITFLSLKNGDMVEYGQIIAHYKPL